MKTLILSFSANKVNESSFIPNKLGLTFACVEECEKALKEKEYEVEHICVNKKNIKKCMACGDRGWGICYEKHKCVLNDDFNELYEYMEEFDSYIFITPVYFWEMSESAKTFFDRLKRCDAFNDNSKIKGKNIICIACAGGSGNGTEQTLSGFDALDYFLNTEMKGRIPVTRFNFEEQKNKIKEAIQQL